MRDARDGPKVVLVVAAEKAMQDSVLAIIEAAGCAPLIAASGAIATTLCQATRPVLVLVDPVCHADVSARLGAGLRIVAIPIRTSAAGVRRVAKRRTAAVRWLREIVETHCSAASTTP
ncbi:MAG: hypothetical protein JWN44_5889 [Myxococcales bacterium]|nr:hypothetical protein [Myxococcales bacterium]